MNLKDSKTYFNLAKAFAGETQAGIRYKFLKYTAEKEGYTALANIIDDVIKQEYNHARMLYSFIQTASGAVIEDIEISSGYPFKEKFNLTDNLKLAAENENKESTKIYPAFMTTANNEGFYDIAGLFTNLAAVEASHEKIFKELYGQMRNGNLYKRNAPVKWRCSDCGYENTLQEAWEECPLCHAKQSAIYIQLEQSR